MLHEVAEFEAAVDAIAKAIEGLVVDESKDLNKADLQLEIDMTKSILAEADKYKMCIRDRNMGLQL